MAIEIKKIKLKMTKSIYLGLSTLDISKTLMYEFCYDYIKPKYGYRSKLCYMDTDSFVIYIETEHFYKYIAGDVERWFDTSSYEENDKRPLTIGKNKKIPGLFKDELGGKIMTLFVGVRAKTYAYLMDDDSEHKKAKGIKKCIIKCRLMVKNYKNCLLNNEIILKTQQRFKSNYHEVYTEEVNKITLSNSDDKRLQIFDKITTYPYRRNAIKVCESEMMIVRDFFVKNYADCPFYDGIILQQR